MFLFEVTTLDRLRIVLQNIFFLKGYLSREGCCISSQFFCVFLMREGQSHIGSKDTTTLQNQKKKKLQLC